MSVSVGSCGEAVFAQLASARCGSIMRTHTEMHVGKLQGVGDRRNCVSVAFNAARSGQ